MACSMTLPENLPGDYWNGACAERPAGSNVQISELYSRVAGRAVRRAAGSVAGWRGQTHGRGSLKPPVPGHVPPLLADISYLGPESRHFSPTSQTESSKALSQSSFNPSSVLAACTFLPPSLPLPHQLSARPSN